MVDISLWQDPYTSQFLTLTFNLEVEHITPLSWAQDHGGANLTVEL